MSCQVNQDPIPITCRVKSIKRSTMSRMILNTKRWTHQDEALDQAIGEPGNGLKVR